MYIKSHARFQKTKRFVRRQIARPCELYSLFSLCLNLAPHGKSHLLMFFCGMNVTYSQQKPT